MAFKGITINTAPEAAAHIYAQDDAAIYQSIFGSDGVFNLGNKFNATVQSNNSVRVSDGIMCVGGHIGRTEYGTYNDLTIQNGASGYKRNDIIYARFLTSGSTDTLTLAVKKGTQTTGTPADPALTQGNLYQKATTREYPLWRVKLEGLSITKVEQMFTVIPTIPELEAKYNALNTDLEKQKSNLVYFSHTIGAASVYEDIQINNPYGTQFAILDIGIMVSTTSRRDLHSYSQITSIDCNSSMIRITKKAASDLKDYMIRGFVLLYPN